MEDTHTHKTESNRPTDSETGEERADPSTKKNNTKRRKSERATIGRRHDTQHRETTNRTTTTTTRKRRRKIRRFGFERKTQVSVR